MKILVANLPGVKITEDGRPRHFVKAGSRWPMTIGFSKTVDYYPFPFMLAYASALLKRETPAEVKGLDGVVRDMTADDFFRAVKDENPDLIICELNFLTLKDDLELLKKIKTEIGSKICVGGYYPTAFGRECLRDNGFIDFVLTGEYEFTDLELVNALLKEGPEDLSSIYGLSFRKDNQIIENKRRELLDDLDKLPYPDREDFPAELYFDFTFFAPCISILSSRGCPCGCTFCQERHILFNSPQYRMRRAESVVDEMEFCIKNFKAKQFYFDDQSFTVNKKHVLAICDEIIKRNIKIPWTCMADAIFIDYEMLKKMKEAGCLGIKFGVESADDEILKQINKPLKLEKALQVVRWCKELNIKTHATFCLGLPGETEETIKKSMLFMEKLKADTSQVSKNIPYPGTPMFEWIKERGYLKTEDLSCFDGTEETVVDYPQLRAERLDYWYKIFARQVGRQKFLRYLKEPRQSFSILSLIAKKKGVLGALRAAITFASRST